MREDKYDRLEELLGERLGEFREEPSAALFDRIEATLSKMEQEQGAVVAAPSPKRYNLWNSRVVRYGVTILAAASLLFGFILLTDRPTPEMELVATIESDEEVSVAPLMVAGTFDTEAPTEALAMATIEPKVAPKLASRAAPKQVPPTTNTTATEVANDTPEQPKAEENTQGRKSASTTSTRRERTHQARKSDAEIEAYWREVLGLDEAPRRLGITHPTEISLYAANVGFNQGNMILENIAAGAMVVNEQTAVQNATSLSTPMFMTQQRGSRLKHLMPVSLGVTASYAVADWLAVESGLIYTHLLSRSLNWGTMSDYTIQRDMHYLGIPLGATIRFANIDRFGLYGRLGGVLEYCVGAKDTSFMDGKREGSKRLSTPGAQFSLDAAAGVNYLLWGGVGLYAEAGVSYWQSTAVHPANYRTENPLGLTCRVGLRFTFR